MSEYAYSNKLRCIISIDFSLFPLGRRLLEYREENKESQNFVYPYHKCNAQMSIRGWKVIISDQRSPQKQSFAIMGRTSHISGCAVKTGEFKLPQNEINEYAKIETVSKEN